MNRLCAAFLVIAAAVIALRRRLSAQSWPNRPVRIVNTFAPGGAADFLARTVAESLADRIRAAVLRRDHAGAAGAIGVNLVAPRRPTATISSSPTSPCWCFRRSAIRSSATIRNKDLTNIAYLGGSPIVLSVNAKGDIKTLADFIAAAKKSPKPMTFSSSGVGSAGHLFGELLAQKLNLKFEHVPYKGAAQGLMDLVGGHIMFSAQTLTSTAGQMRGGTLRGLAVTSKERIKDFPDLPTFNELGYPEFETSIWFSLSAPAGLPKEIAQKVNREIAKSR